MAGNYEKHSKYRSPRSSKSDKNMKTKARKSKHHEYDSKHHLEDSRTPPLPAKKCYSIEVLMKKRHSLRKELKNLEKYTPSYSENKKYKSKDDKHDRRHQETLNSKLETNKSENHNKVPLKRCKSDSSPEYHHNDTQLDSEDEELIIEQRRKRRKQLLEQLNVSNETKTCDTTVQENNDLKINNSPITASTAVPTKPIVTEVTDMFSEKDNFVSNTVSKHVIEDPNNLSENFDDSEGYFIVREGDNIDNTRYTITASLGQGVFANVIQAQDNDNRNMNVAIKIIRNNHLMYKTGLKEIATLREINDADPENKYHCVKLLRNFMHRGHLCIVLESLHMNLRSVLKRYGRHGLHIKALMSYSRQLLMALRLLKKLGIVHADIKPDNIIVNEKKNILKLCDFGSATKVDDNEPTPYLVSRFYRAPEIILGMTSKSGIDMWSAACTIYEMATGKILFTGNSNNKMLKCFMDLKGKIPGRLIRKGKFKDQHFNYNNHFLLHKKDEFTGREKVVEISNITVTRDILKELKKHSKDETPTGERKIGQLKDLLDKMLVLDPSQRPSVTDCLKHPFIQETLQK
ncbi:serine/threonine-protein kinase PRP4 homolog [Epargyreus clarus]|uniref:serine/threonine-protein kinase PRP4 homolog n=1 Tax=Epargyreus clarus TaxID=520877 RepID=UPI003C2B0812